MNQSQRFVRDLIDPLRVAPRKSVVMERDFDPTSVDGTVSRSQAESHLDQVIELLADYQDRLSAQAVSGVLLVIQALDAGGKDSTIKHVMRGLNPQGVEVHSFKEPTDEELRHDFLWRYQRVAPERGRIGIFNRSHYEEVLVVRVHPELLGRQFASGQGPAKGIWRTRFQEINDWERHLVDNNIRLVKVVLNVSKEEQAKRFLKRIDRPEKNWKFAPSDIRERRYWDDYQRAFGKMLSHTNTEWAPWHVVPADHKWFARLATAAILAQALIDIDPHYPRVESAVRQRMAEERAALVTELRLRRSHPGPPVGYES
ncbi:MAG TPA: PPK2 family polyphosphate kinase [Acidimicrobiales bacterium]|jgi:PPK2 family polyphosphate:nucleotide phosphotransferase|nr:PPK2 family polyphosphate kinase [Acidimicrobiales bacterium]